MPWWQGVGRPDTCSRRWPSPRRWWPPGHDRGTIEFVGSTRGQDRMTLEGRGFPFTLLPGRGIVRSLRPRDLVANLGAVAGLAVAAVRGIAVVGRARPRVVVSVGGYASLAASMAAVVRRVPLVLVNVDAVPGAANRLLGRFARASAVGWEGSPLPRAVVTGTPGPPGDRRRGPGPRAAAGGPGGARAPGRPSDGGRLRRLPRGPPHQPGGPGPGRPVEGPGRPVDLPRRRAPGVGRRACGSGSRRPVPPPAERPGGLGLVRVEYQDRMDLVYAAADVVVCRAGAMTVAELAVAGVPSILVPLPGAPGDHQTANARVLERAGAAILLPDARCDAATLATALDGLLAEPGLLEAMGEAAASLGRPDAAAGRRRGGGGQRRAPAPVGPEEGGMTAPAPADVLRHGGQPAVVHVVGIGGAGMSAIATVLQAMGHEVTGSDLKASGGHRAPPAGRASGWPSATLRPMWAPPTWSRCPRPSPRPIPRSPRPGPAACPCSPGPSPWPPSPPCDGAWPWPGPTARPPRRRCWPSCWWRPGSGPRS